MWRNIDLLKEYSDKINSWNTLHERLQDHSQLKEMGADCFHRLLVTRILSKGIKQLFFESGSSIAILARFFRLFTEQHRDNHLCQDLTIETNNILAFLEFELFGHYQIDMYPVGPPEEKYGATFGALGSLPPPPPPMNAQEARSLAYPKNEMAPIRNHFKEKYKEHGIIFMAASGIELSAKNGFEGPHVSSYPNMLFKRILCEIECPIVMFVDQSKIQSGGFSTGTCFPVFDANLSWQKFCSKNPFAIVFGGDSRNKLDDTLKKLKGLGLKNRKIDRDPNTFGVVVSNRKFEDRFPYPDKLTPVIRQQPKKKKVTAKKRQKKR